MAYAFSGVLKLAFTKLEDDLHHFLFRPTTNFLALTNFKRWVASSGCKLFNAQVIREKTELSSFVGQLVQLLRRPGLYLEHEHLEVTPNSSSSSKEYYVLRTCVHITFAIFAQIQRARPCNFSVSKSVEPYLGYK